MKAQVLPRLLPVTDLSVKSEVFTSPTPPRLFGRALQWVSGIMVEWEPSTSSKKISGYIHTNIDEIEGFYFATHAFGTPERSGRALILKARLPGFLG